MEIILSLAVNLLAAGLKKFVPVVGTLSKPVLRFIVLVLSFGVTIGNAAVNGEMVDASVSQVFVEGLATFLASQGFYLLGKK